MRVLFDTNVVLDVLLARPPHVHAASLLMARVEQRLLHGLLCATTLTTIHYIAARTLGGSEARREVADLLRLFEVAPVTRTVLTEALALPFTDFEDAVLHEAARLAGADAILTRNGRDFSGATLAVHAPSDLLALLDTAG